MPHHARLHLPTSALGACVFLGVERDTRGLQLTDSERFNYYPATPLVTISWVLHGALHMVEDSALPAPEATLAPALPRVVIAGPHLTPSASWSPGPVHALSVSFYPDALMHLLGTSVEPLVDKIVPLQDVVNCPLLARLAQVGVLQEGALFQQIQTILQPLWLDLHRDWELPTLRGWVQAMAVRAAFTKSGADIRRAQRRFKDWTGQSYRDLQLFVRTERAMTHASAQPLAEALDLASVAAKAGFSDQSHMGREVRRVTGLSPGRLRELMRSDEAFWFYRLLGDHLRVPGAPEPL